MLQLPWDSLDPSSTPSSTACLPFTLHVGESFADPIITVLTLLHHSTQQASIALDVYASGRNTALSISISATTTVQDLAQEIQRQIDPCTQDSQADQPTAPPEHPAVPWSNVALSLRSPDAAGEAIAPDSLPRDLHWVIDPQSGAGQVIYDAHRFHAATIERMIGHLQTLAAALTQASDRPIVSLSMLTAAEVQQQQVDWSSPTVSYPADPIFHTIEHQATQQPEAIALRYRGQALTYQDLNQRANQLAHCLLGIGVTTGMRVATCFESSFEAIIGILAIFKTGGIYVPLDPSHPSDRLTTILEETQPPILLTQSHLVPVLPAIAPPVLCLDQDWHQVASQPTHNPNREIDLDQTAYIIYTSGTTGKPKGVMASHRNLVNYIWSAHHTYGFNANDIMPAMARFTFSITMFELWSPLVAGGQLQLLDRDQIFDFKQMVALLQTITAIHISPSLLRRLLAYIQEQHLPSDAFQTLRHISSGGDMVSADLLDTMRAVFPMAEIYVIYGCSEISCMGCTYPVPLQRPVTKSRVGKPFPNVSVRLYTENQRLVPVGMVGEICFGGAGITQGYLDRDELTQEKFVWIDGQRFYRTGDLGRFEPDGTLEILGRSDFQIKLRGIRIEPGEIEVTLRQAPGVRDAVVAAQEMRLGEKSLIGYLVLNEPETPELIAEIRQFLQGKLPDYMVPSGFMVLEALPLNINQKVDRKALPIPTPQDLAGAKPLVPPSTETEQKLVEIWELVLGVSPVGVHDSFFDIGGDSLQSIALMEAIERTFGRVLPLSTLLTEPTIAELAAVLEQSKESTIHESVVLLKKGGDRPPIFFIHDGEGETLLYRNLALNLHPDHPVYGIQPYSRDGFPILHTRLLDIAEYYTQKIRGVQPEGPYYLGGLCIGGFIAFEIARILRKDGQAVEMVALIDTADVKAQLRPGLITGNRLDRFSKSLGEGRKKPLYQRIPAMAAVVAKKATNLILYEVTSRLEKKRSHLKMRLLRLYLDRQWPLATFLQDISVRVALKFAETEYVPAAPYAGEVLLFLATEKSSVFDGTQIDDTPYAELYSDPLLGWAERAEQIGVHRVPGGHSSMLQEPNVATLATIMQTYIDQSLHQDPSASQDKRSLAIARQP
jgi:amino acid adenylation domain-containing protein